MAFKRDDDYVEVAERITKFYAAHPDGRLTRVGEPKILEVAGKTFVLYTAKAYRTPDDPVPAVGTAWEPFPGTTPYTKDSELMNAETAAWGRAIIAAGIPSKKIASKDEVQARRSGGGGSDITPPGDARLSEPMYERLKAKYAAAGAPEGPVSAWLDAEKVKTAASLAGRIALLKASQAVRLEQFLDDPGQEAAA